jgi:hypothetical protein
MVAHHYRWDFIGLSSQQKPTPVTSEKVVDGSTFYEADTSKLYVFCKTQWYEKEATGGGGGTTYTAGDGIDITDDTISVDTDTIQEKLTAGTGIDITDNTISATGGGGGGGAIKLTTADYNYDTNGGTNYNSIALWLLPDDIYQMPDSSVSVTGAISGSNYNNFNIWLNNRDGKYFIKSNNKFWFMADPSSEDSNIGTGAPFYYCTVNSSGYFYVNLNVQLVTKSQLPS